MAGPSAVEYDFIPSKTPVPYWRPCARTCTFASPQGTSLPLNQIDSVGVNPMSNSRLKYISRRPSGTDISHGRVRIPHREEAHPSRPDTGHRDGRARLLLPGRHAGEPHWTRTGGRSPQRGDRVLSVRVQVGE